MKDLLITKRFIFIFITEIHEGFIYYSKIFIQKEKTYK